MKVSLQHLQKKPLYFFAAFYPANRVQSDPVQSGPTPSLIEQLFCMMMTNSSKMRSLTSPGYSCYRKSLPRRRVSICPWDLTSAACCRMLCCLDSMVLMLAPNVGRSLCCRSPYRCGPVCVHFNESRGDGFGYDYFSIFLGMIEPTDSYSLELTPSSRTWNARRGSADRVGLLLRLRP